MNTSQPTPSQVRFPVAAASLASAAVLISAMGLTNEFFDANPVIPRAAKRVIKQSAVDNFTFDVSVEGAAQTSKDFEANGGRYFGDDKLDGLSEESEHKDRSATESRPVIDFRRRLEIQDKDESYRENSHNAALQSTLETAHKSKFARHLPRAGALRRDSVYIPSGPPAGDLTDLLAHYRQTQNLQIQPRSGYWANSYVPGDPQIRLLRAKLTQVDRSWLQDNSSLEQSIEPIEQPFDAPKDNALALNLLSDVQTISSGFTRLRLQIGIRGIEHRRGQRPAMNVTAVIDLPDTAPDDVRIAARALLDALLASKQAGDHFSLVMTNGLVLTDDEFRHGPLQLARQIIAGQQIMPQGDRMDLPQALAQAAALTGESVDSMDDGRPLGSRSVIFISAAPIAQIDQIVALAHQQAKNGTTLSVVPLGDELGLDDVDQLVLAGLGHRRFLESPAEAGLLIQNELHAVSRAVARAVRLSIRLAPGVQLIDVIGSEPLDGRRIARVHEIENSMDRRLAATLGIQPDRGEDEDGIQIVIPGVYSGDSLKVLVDLITDRPGAIADVSLRYKDLVFLRNGSLRSHFSLPAGESGAPGPAQRSVSKNILAHHFAEAITQATDAMAQRDPDQARRVLQTMQRNIETAQLHTPAWTNDPDLARDRQLLRDYLAAIAALTVDGPDDHRLFLADSLRYAAWAKTHRLPDEWR